MNAPAKLEDRRVERLWRQIRAKLVPQTVVSRGNGKFYLIDSTGPRVDALLASPQWALCVLGTFSPDVGYEVLCEEVG